MHKKSCAVILALLFFFPITTFAEDAYDPWESMNRGTFWFNDKADVYFLEPVARGYAWVMPDFMEEGVGNFFRNLRYPRYLFSDIVQLKFGQALEHTGRFIVNSTVGIFGLIDVAKHLGLPDHNEDFGIALAYHGVGAGPYIVLPFLGPSNVRDGLGLIVDAALDPFYFITFTSVDSDITTPLAWGASGLKFVQTRAELLDAVEAAKESSVDYYLFMQSAYYQYRTGLIYDGDIPGQDEFGDEDFSDADLGDIDTGEANPVAADEAAKEKAEEK